MIVEEFAPIRDWNNMKKIRAAYGLPVDDEFLVEFLDWWVEAFTPEQRREIRTMDLSKLAESDLPKPPEAMFHASE